MATFPTSIPNLSNPLATTKLGTSDAALKHATQHGNANDEIEAIAAKVGIGSSTPTASTVLRGTGTGTSGYGQVVNGDLNLTWTTFTPTLQQNGAVSHTVNYARSCIVGKMALVQLKITATGAGSSGQAVQVTLPAGLTAARTGSVDPAGVGVVDRFGSTFYQGACVFTTGTTVHIRIDQSTGDIGANPSFALANNDGVLMNLAYELA